jgi:hypothetical protein
MKPKTDKENKQAQKQTSKHKEWKQKENKETGLAKPQTKRNETKPPREMADHGG